MGLAETKLGLIPAARGLCALCVYVVSTFFGARGRKVGCFDPCGLTRES